MEVEYTSPRNSDILVYTGALIYQNEVVQTMLFNYLQFKVKLWNHFINFGNSE